MMLAEYFCYGSLEKTANHVNVDNDSAVTKSTITLPSMGKLIAAAIRSNVFHLTSYEEKLEDVNTNWWLTFDFIDHHAQIYINVSKHVINATGTLTIGNKKEKFETKKMDDKCCIYTWYDDDRSDNDSVTCTVEFKGVLEPIKVLTINDFVNTEDYPPDVKIVVDESNLEVHQHFLRMLSPVFNAYFTHNSKEAQTGIVKIDDFKFQTVKNAIDYFYGRKISNLSIEETIDILRFADKYDVKSITNAVEKVLLHRLSCANFCPVATFAWEFERKKLKENCCDYYKDNRSKLIVDENFLNLPTTTREEIMRSAVPPEDTSLTRKRHAENTQPPSTSVKRSAGLFW